MDTIQPMSQERFLELLNKAERNAEEEVELTTELKRQAGEAQAQTPTTPQVEGVDTEAQSVVDNAQAPAANPAEAPVATDATPTPATPEVAVTETPATSESVASAEPAAPYSLDQLDGDTKEAIDYLNGLDQTDAVVMARAHFEQAAYWVRLASK